MKAVVRKSLLWLTLAGMATLFVFDPVPQRKTIVQPSAVRMSPPDDNVQVNTLSTVATDPILPIRARVAMSGPSTAFTRKDWTPPPAPIPPPPPPVPQAPPLPFTFLGKQLAGGRWTIFLSYQGQTTVVQEGQELGFAYRVTQIKPPSMAVIYLPLNQTQYLPIGQSE